MWKTKYFQLAFPTYLVFVHMVLSQLSVSGLLRGHREVDSSKGVVNYFHLYSMSSGMHVEIKGKIPYANSTKETDYTKLEIRSHPVGSTMGETGRVAVTLMGNQVGRYLCFSRKGKLITRFKGTDPTCLFKEVFTDDGSYEFHLLDDPTWKLGFNHKGKPLPAFAPHPMRHTEGSTKFMERGKGPTHHWVDVPGPVRSSEALANSVRMKELGRSVEKRFASFRAQTRRRRGVTFASSTTSRAPITLSVREILRLLKLLE